MLIVFKMNHVRMEDALFPKDIHAVTIFIAITLKFAQAKKKSKKIIFHP